MIDFSKLDKVIHERARLSLMTLLAARADWAFQDLKAELQMSDGNLITHLRTLSEAGFITSSKLASEARPQTNYSLTPEGRHAFTAYLAVLEAIVQSAKK
jgi:DNA-binding HxlR family transcriptional regulator